MRHSGMQGGPREIRMHRGVMGAGVAKYQLPHPLHNFLSAAFWELVRGSGERVTWAGWYFQAMDRNYLMRPCQWEVGLAGRGR